MSKATEEEIKKPRDVESFEKKDKIDYSERCGKVLKKSFRDMDLNGDQRISVKEFKVAVKKDFQLDVTDAEVKELFREVDENGDGFLNFKEYEAMMYDRIEAAVMEEKYLQEMFSKMDKNRNGKVSYTELAKAMGISKEKAKEFIKEADANGDESISYAEFAAAYRNENAGQ